MLSHCVLKFGYPFVFGFTSFIIWLTSVKADVIFIEDNKSIFASGYTIEMNSVDVNATVAGSRYWSVNNELVYGILCDESVMMCVVQSVPPNSYTVTGSYFIAKNSVNTTIRFRSDQPASLSIKIVNSLLTDLSPVAAVELKNCDKDSPVQNENVDLMHLTRTYLYNESVIVECSADKKVNVTLTCQSDVTWSADGPCPMDSESTTTENTGGDDDGSNGLSTGAKVGIGIVTCAGVAGLVIVGVLIYKKKNEG